jgi:motility quorum-sensing regulator/GCU-specific mRNA interferase toxin
VEKRRPSHDLEAFKRVAGNPATLRITYVAQRNARDLGFDLPDTAAMVRAMDRRMFYKSMTSFADHRSWEDVYHLPTESGLTIYLKSPATL